MRAPPADPPVAPLLLTPELSPGHLLLCCRDVLIDLEGKTLVLAVRGIDRGQSVSRTLPKVNLLQPKQHAEPLSHIG
jgi:hypothetical protein